MMSRLLGTVALIAFLLGGAGPSFAAKHTIRFITSQEPSTPFGEGARRFAELVEKGTKGDVKVEILYHGKFGNEKLSQIGIAKAVSEGKLEMAEDATTPLSNFHDKLAVLDLPFLFRDYAHVDKVLDGPIGQKLGEGLLPHKMRVLGYAYYGWRIIPTVNKEIHRPEDLKGLRVRTMEGKVYMSLYNGWGAQSVPAPVREIIPMAKKGFIDGADRSYPTFWNYNQQEVFKVVNETYHTFAVEAWLIHEPFFQSLPKNDQSVIRNAAQQATKLARIRFRANSEEVQRFCQKEGIKIVKLTPEGRKLFQESSRAVYDQFTPFFGAGLIKEIREVK